MTCRGRCPVHGGRGLRHIFNDLRFQPMHDPDYYCFRFPWRYLATITELWDPHAVDPEDRPWRGYS